MKPILFFCFFISIIISSDYEPNWRSLNSRPTPQWFKDAKFGIFIHWGLYSVPAWGPKGSYAEWYLNGLNTGDTARLRYHEQNYGKDFLYRDFINLFNPINYDSDRWAELFKNAGAKYVVLTSKHHDGFCLWPNQQSRGYNSFDGIAGRDLLGELNKSVKEIGLRAGFYYSLYEWDHPDYPENLPKYVNNYMMPQLKDAVQRYSPDIIFSDGEWDRSSYEWKSEKFLAWLYNESNAPEDVVVNDRWGGETRFQHGGYFSTEYDPSSDYIDENFITRGWEECRGMGKSFGYNKNEDLDDYNTSTELIRLLVDIVSRGGNLLLNIGPKSDGSIPDLMVNRLSEIGEWLNQNGESIYGTTVNRKFSSGKVKFTLSKNRKYLFAFLNDFKSGELVIKDINAHGIDQVVHLGKNKKLNWRNKDDNLIIQIPDMVRTALGDSPVHVFKIPVLPFLDAPDVDIAILNNHAEVKISTKDLQTEIFYFFGDNDKGDFIHKVYDGPFRVDRPIMLNYYSAKKNWQSSQIISKPVELLSDLNGLRKRTFLGKWDNCDQMLEVPALIDTISLDFSIDDFRGDEFGHSFSGFLRIDVDGTYEFKTISDDGSRIIIDEFPLVDNDGLHGRETVEGSMPLKKGFHAIRLDYFERGGQQFLDIQWKGPGFNWRHIPSFLLYQSNEGYNKLGGEDEKRD